LKFIHYRHLFALKRPLNNLQIAYGSTSISSYTDLHHSEIFQCCAPASPYAVDVKFKPQK